jgi:ribosomal peptide maturation radical SAM protein 1
MILKLDFDGILSDADALIIIPPFDDLRWPVLGAHLLQACSKEKGYNVRVFYANMALAAMTGEEIYQKISDKRFLGEAFFTKITYSSPAFYKNSSLLNHFQNELSDCQIETKNLIKLEKIIEQWADDVVSYILKYRFKIVGCSTTFGHIAASICLLNKIKTIVPSIITVIGGAYCYGELIQGVASLTDKIDYIFSGDSEITFPSLINDVLTNRLPVKRIISAEKPNIAENPVPDYTDYFEQSKRFLPASDREIMIIYETSRGCWWGQKKPCNFCGLNCDLKYQFKPLEKVIEDLKYLTNRFPGYRVGMADCIMPHDYFKTVLPAISEELPGVEFFYEIKANLNLEQVILLKKAGITKVQPGIESLSSALLKRMNKGCLARHNVALLRCCRSVGITPLWNFLYHFPGEAFDDYQAMLRLIPLIKHFNPPNKITPVALFRYSQYFNHPDQFGIKNISPAPVYNALLPEWADITQYAYDFDSEFNQLRNEDNSIVKEVLAKAEEWKNTWKEKNPPKLKLTCIPGNKYLLIDSRGLVNPLTSYINEKQAMAILLDWPVNAAYKVKEEIQWALKHQLMIELDSWYVSLVTAEPGLILECKAQVEEFCPWQDYPAEMNDCYQFG